ncbi:hypothetical protein PTE30175_04000 [Pandoraea terrae]|uniref:DUF4148 domain-containing protein n=1 Tax=Pandoraea terrae TaxID=1537710 RepID=A0A5E4XTX2_9BURK|nr:DUF4148 domain-containing protein [Pandoraea terrae]VVE39847.1 hypothetical protein PTE30175_04000 [Pandoraea terrae]
MQHVLKNTLCALGFALAALPALAQSSATTQPSPGGKTRAAVRAELQAAIELGLAPITEFNYPYTPGQAQQLAARAEQIKSQQGITH